MLSGSVPFRADTPLATLNQHVSMPVPSIRSVNPHLPQWIDNIIQKALAKDREARYQSAAEMADDLRKGLSGREREIGAVQPQRPTAAPPHPPISVTGLIGPGADTNIQAGGGGRNGKGRWIRAALLVAIAAFIALIIYVAAVRPTGEGNGVGDGGGSPPPPPKKYLLTVTSNVLKPTLNVTEVSSKTMRADFTFDSSNMKATIELEEGEYKLVGSKSGYEPAVSEVRIDGKTELKPQPLRFYKIFTITSDPPDAEKKVTCDGKLITYKGKPVSGKGTLTFTEESLTGKQICIAVSKDGYQSKSEELTVGKNAPGGPIKLERIQPTGPTWRNTGGRGQRTFTGGGKTWGGSGGRKSGGSGGRKTGGSVPDFGKIKR
jgi:hypothetical protein